MEVLRDGLPGLDESTYAFLWAAIEDSSSADLAEILDPYCEELGLATVDRQRLCRELAASSAGAASAIAEAAAGAQESSLLGRPLPLGALREFWAEEEPPRQEADDAAADASAAAVQPGGGKPEAAELEEPPWLEGAVGAVEDQADLPAWAKRLFAGAWRCELLAWPRQLSSEQVAHLAVTLSDRGEKLAGIISSSSFDGGLCLAGGLPMLLERLGGLSKADASASKALSRRLIDALQAADMDADSYLDLLRSRSDVAMLQSFRGTPVEPCLRRALGPAQPRYVVCHAREDPKGWGPASIKAVDAELQQLWGSEVAEETWRVVAVLDGGVVRQNLIFMRDTSWYLLASVDFCQHGDAAPGHWHLNRTPTGDRVEHWGPAGDVFHGSCWTCPLWWQVIPAGLEYRSRPARLDLLPFHSFGSVGKV